MKLGTVFAISRPRFWLYTAGPFLIGTAAASTTTLHSGWTLLFLVYFLLPANLFVYGVNDTYDYESDKDNPKKKGYEHLVTPALHGSLMRWIIGTNLVFWIIAFGLPYSQLLTMLGFLLFGLFYSAPPIRAKTKPFLDSIFNILYLFPGFFGYYLAGGSNFHLPIFLAGTFWVMAMHAFSAIPDIEADTKASISTIATKLGKTGTLMFCLVCYVAAAALTYFTLPALSIILGSVYTVLMLLSMAGKQNSRIFQVYTWFPIINTIAGFSIFLSLVL